MKQLVLVIAVAWPSMLPAQHDPSSRLKGSDGVIGDDRFSVVYDAETGELSAESPPGGEIIIMSLFSDSGIFTECANLRRVTGGEYCDAHEVGEWSWGSSRSFSFGEVLKPDLLDDLLLADLRYVASVLPTRFAIPSSVNEFDLVYIPVPEPSALGLAVLGLLAFVVVPARFGARHSRRQ